MLDDLIKALQDMREKHGNTPVEFVLHSYYQTHPTVYIRLNNFGEFRIYKAHDGAVRITLHTGEDVRLSILHKKVIAFVSDD